MKFLDTVIATHYICPLPNSSTNALLIICNDGKEYVLKHAGLKDAGGTNILIAEYLSYLVAQRFNLPIPEHRFIQLNEKFFSTIAEKKLSTMLKTCPELCIGSVFIHGTTSFEDALKIKNNSYKMLFKTIFAFDQYLYNADRFIENPNLLFIPQTNDVKVIDHSMAIWPILDFEESLTAPIKNRTEHVLFPYAKGDWSYFVSIVKEIYDVTIEYYINTIPEEWFTEDMDKRFLTEFFQSRRDKIGDILKGVRKCQKKATNSNLSLF